jgi:hypothetical protein
LPESFAVGLITGLGEFYLNAAPRLAAARRGGSKNLPITESARRCPVLPGHKEQLGQAGTKGVQPPDYHQFNQLEFRVFQQPIKAWTVHARLARPIREDGRGPLRTPAEFLQFAWMPEVVHLVCGKTRATGRAN